VPKGAVYVLVGPNGAGKTTMIRILLDLVRGDAGTAAVLGRDSVTDGAAVRAACGYLPEREDAGYPWMTVDQLLAHHASFRPTWDAPYAGELIDRLGVRSHAKFGKLSKGESRRVQLVMTLAHRPPVLLLDEPTDGLDPVMREEALTVLTEHIAACEPTVLISTHLVSEVEGLGDHLGVLREGVLTAQMSRETLWTNVRRYVIATNGEWSGAPDLEDRVIRRSGGDREVAWTVWGSQDEVVAGLSAAGATVRDVQPLTLEEAAIALLTTTWIGARDGSMRRPAEVRERGAV
jgi:ABC-2 type transport system ATP-binding protein